MALRDVTLKRISLALILSALAFVALPNFPLLAHAHSSGSVQRSVSSSTTTDGGLRTTGALSVSRSEPMAPAPSDPANIGGCNCPTDWAMQSSAGTTITSVKGSFPIVIGATSETDIPAGDDDTWSLQINTNRFTCQTPFTAGVRWPMCWEQFVFVQPDDGEGNVHIEYWLLGYASANCIPSGLGCLPACPSMNVPDGNSWRVSGNSCVVDTGTTDTAIEHITSLGAKTLTADTTGPLGDCVTFTDSGQSWNHCEPDSVLGLSSQWTDVEFNIFGFGNLSQARFNTASSITVEVDASLQGTNPQLTCPSPSTTSFNGWTGETNNLNLVGGCNAAPPPAPYNGAFRFTESTFDFSISPQTSPLNFVMLNGGTATFQVGTLFLVSDPAGPVTLTAVFGQGTSCSLSFTSGPVTPTATGAAVSLTIPLPNNSNCLGDFTGSITANDGPFLFRPQVPCSPPTPGGTGCPAPIPANIHIYDFTITAPSNMQVLTTGSNQFTITVTLTAGSSTFALPMVDLTLTGLPSGATSGFSPNIALPSFTSTLTITTLNTPGGTYPLTITGTPSGFLGKTFRPTLTVLTPVRALPLVSNQLKTFQAAGFLTMGQATSLNSKLDAAISSLSLNDPDTRTACNQLNAFVNEVNSLVAEGVLTQAQASQLLNGPLGINAIMVAIPC